MSQDQNIQHELLNEDNLFVGHGPTSTQSGKLIHSTNMSGPSRDEEPHTPNDDYEGDKYFEDNPAERSTPAFDELVADSMTDRQFDAVRDLCCLPRDVRENDPAYQNLLEDVTQNMVYVLEERNEGFDFADETNGLGDRDVEELSPEKRQEIIRGALGGATDRYEELSLRANYQPMSAEDDSHPPLDEVEKAELRDYEAEIRRAVADYYDVDPMRGNEEPDLSNREVPALQAAMDSFEAGVNRSNHYKRYWSNNTDFQDADIEYMDLKAIQDERDLYEKDPEGYWDEEPRGLDEAEKEEMARLQEVLEQHQPDAAEMHAREQEFLDDVKAKLQERGYDLDSLEEPDMASDFGR
ncbi:MAG: hypothetical protein VX730_07650 [Pseudomonadota bacterium]|nr:hypothetical protein [Pseudomonadota bacterium]